MDSSAVCGRGAKEQTIDHVILHCPIRQSSPWSAWPYGPVDETIEWLLNTCPEIQCGL